MHAIMNAIHSWLSLHDKGVPVRALPYSDHEDFDAAMRCLIAIGEVTVYYNHEVVKYARLVQPVRHEVDHMDCGSPVGRVF